MIAVDHVPIPDLPSHSELVKELRGLRKAGLPRLRQVPHAALAEAAAAAGLTAGQHDPAQGIERLLVRAVGWLDGHPDGHVDTEPSDILARAAALSFGLPAQRGQLGTVRRKAAASVYGVTTESFRHRQELQVMDRLADAMLWLARRGPGPRVGLHAALTTEPPQHFDSPPPAVTQDALGIEVHLAPIELLRGIDILVSPENTYLEMSKTFSSTVSGALRRAAAVRDEANAILDDSLARELAQWLTEHGRVGTGVPVGTVVPTGPGALAVHGVRRIHHAAIAVPHPASYGYAVNGGSVADAVKGCFRMAAAERDHFTPPLASLCFPVLGAGRGGLPPDLAARWLRWAVEEELRSDPRWRVHLVTIHTELVPVLRGAS